MTAATEEEKAAKAAEKDQAAENKRQADAAEKDKAETEQRLNASSVADAEAKAMTDLREQVRQEERQRLLDEAKGDGHGDAFGGQVHSSKHFVVTTSEQFGRSAVEVKAAGWVGPGFEVAPARVKELAKLLGSIENLPEQE